MRGESPLHPLRLPHSESPEQQAARKQPTATRLQLRDSEPENPRGRARAPPGDPGGRAAGPSTVAPPRVP
eukprot:2059504-Rhodomonas_salina.2